ncbi:crossover junction endodeoxyribonuclease RuvC [Leptospira wolffii]|uniref:crossover junction endodeoxyribonuclease RuvC n=1 Tax=Leptospira wolffii TaxID=409998 RepID=UPI0002D6FB39|nr:crossover junction endodeoxyribonuclease RuvC [Leptospira wolffii]EPG66354.1 putative crossover junction endodeoxyribonuclease RuvC [Leptospira wolffii serovar Khorat str. Khorat-H2]
MRILGIDPGSHRLGYAVLHKEKSRIQVLTYGTIEVPPGTKSPVNLIAIRRQLDAILDEYRPEIASVEDLFFSKNRTTAAQVYESRGVVLLTLGEHNIQILEPTASQIKKGTTGSGTADKKNVKSALKLLLSLEELTGHDDSWDAIASAYVGLAMVGPLGKR